MGKKKNSKTTVEQPREQSSPKKEPIDCQWPVPEPFTLYCLFFYKNENEATPQAIVNIGNSIVKELSVT